MGDIVNLKRFKKKLEREQASKQAEENRARHGRTKTERQRDLDANQKLNSQLDRHCLGKEDA